MTNQIIQSIKELKAGQKLSTFYILRKMDLKFRKDGVPYLMLEFSDATGRIPAVLWDNAQSVYDELDVGEPVKLQGNVTEYRSNRQINIEKIRIAIPDDQINMSDFLPRGNFDPDTLMADLDKVIESIKDAHLRQLLERYLKNDIIRDKYKKAPGGKLWHHAYLGGLVEHTLAVLGICEAACKLHPKTNRDLVITGAVLHDIGKLEEYGFDQGFIDFTDEGRLWGHISIGAQMVRKTIEEMEKESGFPLELKRQLIHLILSHQGELDHGSPVVPMMPEAMILYYADEMDSKVNALERIIEQESGEGQKWSKYVNLIERFIYFGEKGGKEPPEQKQLNLE